MGWRRKRYGFFADNWLNKRINYLNSTYLFIIEWKIMGIITKYQNSNFLHSMFWQLSFDDVGKAVCISVKVGLFFCDTSFRQHSVPESPIPAYLYRCRCYQGKIFRVSWGLEVSCKRKLIINRSRILIGIWETGTVTYRRRHIKLSLLRCKRVN